MIASYHWSELQDARFIDKPVKKESVAGLVFELQQSY
jgi:hypothetical protein